MSAFVATLGPRQIGAEILIHIARKRLSGTLSFTISSQTRRLLFREGRAEMGIAPDDTTRTDRAAVSHGVRQFAGMITGRCAFALESALAADAPNLNIDTLGEALMALMQLSPTQLDAFCEARAKNKVEALPGFAKLAQAVQSVGGPAIAAPAGPVTFASLTANADGPQQRAWAAVLVLGGLRSDALALNLEAPPVLVAAPASPADLQAAQMTAEIDAAHARLMPLNLFQFLNIATDAPADVVRRAYFEQAKLWHSDRFANVNLDPATRTKAEELFRRADEANKVLSNAEERQSYVWVSERQAQGLPTDPMVVLEAEGLFHKGESLVRRGQAASAEPILRKAVEMNKGEAEFWAYFGFALFSAKGVSSLPEAMEAINKALTMHPNMDAAYEFLGRIAQIQGQTSLARQHLDKCLELNPKNREAERTLRLLSMRDDQAKADKKSDKESGLLGRILKR